MKDVGEIPIDFLVELPLEESQSILASTYLLKGAKLGGSRSKYTQEELELYATNPPLEPSQNVLNIFINNFLGLGGESFTLHDIHPNATVLYLRHLIKQETGIPIHFQRLHTNVRNWDCFSTIAECQLGEQPRINLSGRLLSGPAEPARSSPPPTHLLDDQFHLDLRNIRDDGQISYVGGSVYNRPYGWMFFTLKSPRSSANAEWPVSYHGTGRHHGLGISSQCHKLLLRKGVRFPLGYGAFSTPDYQLARLFAQTVTVDRVAYKVIIQNRVNFKTLFKISDDEDGEYWMSPNKGDIRPYGFCVRKILKL